MSQFTITSQGIPLSSSNQGSHAIFAVTDFFATFATHSAEETVAIEATQGVNAAKAASKTATLEHYVWSTLPDNIKISGGKCPVPHFESKAKVDKYIRQDKTLLNKTTFMFVTYYASNVHMPMFTPNFFVSEAFDNPLLTTLSLTSSLTFL